MKTIFLIVAVLSVPLTAAADQWRAYLEIVCEPSILQFSVRPAGTWSFDAEPPGNFIPVDRGWSYSSSGHTKIDGSDTFASCELPVEAPETGVQNVRFEVIRTQSYPPADCSMCGNWMGTFVVRANGVVLAEGLVGRRDVLSMSSVWYDGEEVLICNVPGYHQFRDQDDAGRFELSCRSVTSGDLLRAIRSQDN